MVIIWGINLCTWCVRSPWPWICVKYFVSFPQKTLTTEKTETNKVFTFWFLSDKVYSFNKKSHLSLGNLAKLMFWSISLLKNGKLKTLFVKFFSGDRFFEKTRENILHIFQAHISIIWRHIVIHDRCMAHLFLWFLESQTSFKINGPWWFSVGRIHYKLR